MPACFVFGLRQILSTCNVIENRSRGSLHEVAITFVMSMLRTHSR